MNRIYHSNCDAFRLSSPRHLRHLHPQPSLTPHNDEACPCHRCRPCCRPCGHCGTHRLWAMPDWCAVVGITLSLVSLSHASLYTYRVQHGRCCVLCWSRVHVRHSYCRGRGPCCSDSVQRGARDLLDDVRNCRPAGPDALKMLSRLTV